MRVLVKPRGAVVVPRAGARRRGEDLRECNLLSPQVGVGISAFSRNVPRGRSALCAW